MGRVLVRTQAWGTIWDRDGNALANLPVTLKNTDGSTATHYAVEVGGASSTAALATDDDGGIVLMSDRSDRWVDGSTEYDLTVNGKTYRVMSGGVGGSVYTTGVRKEINPCMSPYNAMGNGTTDDTSALLAATEDARNQGKRMVVPSGTYKCSDVITNAANTNPLVVEGDDPETTVFTMTAGTWTNGLFNFSGAGFGSGKTFSAPTVAGANVITISSTSGLVAGDVIYIVDATQTIIGSSTRVTASLFGGFARIKSVDSGAQLTLHQKLDLPYTTSASAFKYTGQALSMRGVGLRNLNPGTLPVTARGISATYFRDLNLSHLAFQDMDADCINAQIGIDATISDLEFLDTRDVESGNAPYCVALAKAVSHVLVQHIRSRYGRHLITTLPTTAYAAPSYIKIADSIATEHSESAFDCHPGTRKMTFENCESHGSGPSGVAPNGFQIRGPDCEVLNCKAFGQGQAGVSVIYGADRCRIVGGRFAACDSGISIESSDDCFIGGDILLKDCVTNGVNVIRDAAYSSNMNLLTLGDVEITGSPTNPINDTTSGAVSIFKSGRVRTPSATAVMSAGNVDTLWNPFRSSNVSTLPWQITAKNTVSMTSGSVFSMPAVVRETGTYSQIRFGVGTTAPGGTYTDCRAGVYNAAGTSKLADTGNQVATVTTANTVYTIALGTTLTLYAGQVVQLSVGFIASTAPNLLGVVAPTGLTGLSPVKGGSTTGWTTGSVLPSTVTVTGNSSTMIFAELLH